MSLEALPPARHISSKPISTVDASLMLETYLTHSESHPHLHPDALITPIGVTFSSHGGPLGSVVMHNLRRVAAGLRGEYFEPEKTPEPEEDSGAKKSSKNKRKDLSTTMADADWQDKAEYEAEQGGVEVGEVGDRTNVVQGGGEEPEIQLTGGAAQNGAKKRKTGAQAMTDKEARKAAKKEREKAWKREKAAKHQNKEA
ncbi:hypothetical protein ACEQ8H_000121 [Pleosporales sp. CAS-2024a]